MVSVNGYYDGNVCVLTDSVEVQPRQNVIITFLGTVSSQPNKTESPIRKIFGSLSEDEAEEIRNNRVHFGEK